MNRENFILSHNVFKKMLGVALAIGAIGTASATPVELLTGNSPMLTSGAAPDSPDARVDPNVSSSPFSGVVSIATQYDGKQFICTGTLVGKRQVVTAGHCVDTDGKGTLIDLKKQGNNVLVVFNSNGTSNSVVAASSVSMHKDYNGFGVCPTGSGLVGQCLNDDVAVVTLNRDAPASAKIYKIATVDLQSGSHIIMAGYGTSGDGVNGYTVSPSYYIKRTGENYVDLFGLDDEKGRTGDAEVWYGDFDGGGRDTFCTRYGVCSPVLPNNRESGIGGGDSGGPSFIEMYGELMLIATNTFGNKAGYTDGAFGTYFGGMVLKSYLDYISEATGGKAQFVPEPATTAMFGLGLLALAGARRRKQQK